MDSHPSCRRPHKLPAHTVKDPGSRPQRLPPCPDVSVEVSRTFWQLVLEVSTPRRDIFIFLSTWRRTASVEVSRTFWQLVLEVSTPCCGAFIFPSASAANRFGRGEPHMLAARSGSVNTRAGLFVSVPLVASNQAIRFQQVGRPL